MWEPIDRQYLLQKGDQLTKFQLAKLKKSKRFCLLSNNDANYRELWNSSLCTVIRHRPNGHTRRSWSNDYKTKKVQKSDGQQFHQFQQDEQSTLTSSYWTQEKDHDIWLGTPGCGLKQAQQCGGAKPTWELTVELRTINPLYYKLCWCIVEYYILFICHKV